MSPDPTPTHPNADLVGHSFEVDGGRIVVTGVSPVPGYVEVDTPDGPSLRVAAQVRRREELS